MLTLIVEPQKAPRTEEITGELNEMQAIVGGLIQVLYPFEDEAALVCNDEGKLLGLPANRALRDEIMGKPYDILCGTFFVCGAPTDSDSFASLTDIQVQKYQALFRQPEMFLNVDGHIIILPCD